MMDDADDADETVASPYRGVSPNNHLLVDGPSPHCGLGTRDSVTPEKRCHINVELAQCKAKMRRLRHEM